MKNLRVKSPTRSIQIPTSSQLLWRLRGFLREHFAKHSEDHFPGEWWKIQLVRMVSAKVFPKAN